MSLIWLLNAQVNSMLEPKILTRQADEKIRAFGDELKSFRLSGKDKELIKKELENALEYIKDMKYELGKLEQSISDFVGAVLEV